MLVAALMASCGGTGTTGKEAPDVRALEVVVLGGQSNSSGANVDADGSNNPPAGVPTGSIGLFRRIPFGVDPAVSDTVLRDLQKTVTGTWTYHGAELKLGLSLRAALPPTTRVVILKASAGGSFITDWIGAGTYAAGLQTAISDLQTLLAAAYPSVPIRWHWVWNQGEQEARDTTEAAALAWATNFATLKTNMQTYTGQTLRPHIINTISALAGGTWITTVRARQATAASAAGGYLLSVDSALTGNLQTDGIHWTGTGQNAVGAIEAASILADIATH